ncbi:AMIN domain-containing protein [Microcoleus sp. LEGE 07076]|uniref:AMIN domain-containing protein n=1 Tax=Microcoleus sp. LEGE 07076 TaxID=915322 RepID=UPI001880BF3B|nr:AMIN domain-containing protein [Microcoleus sp. LEGE 07076]MBE9188054.1 AMIN domain-containing protein [Microcoleus sp. LEGE 07076]
MPYKTLFTRFGEDLPKLTVNSVAPGLFAIESLSLSLAVAAAVATVQITQQPANASTVTSWQFDPATNQLEITLPEGTTPQYSLINPSQIAVDLPNTEIGVDATQLYPQGTVRSVGVSQLRAGTTRILVNLAPGSAFNGEQIQFQRIGVENRWVLRPQIELTQSGEIPKTQPQPGIQVPPNELPIDSNSTVAAEVDRQSSPASGNLTTNYSPQTTPNDQIRPITVPLVSVRLDERQGGRAAAVRSLAPQNTAAAMPQQPTLTFGEPLPGDRPNRPRQVAAGANVLLAAGSELNLQYPGDRPLRLAGAKPSRQEVLLLQGGILDSRGNTIVPANTPVIGRFETTNLGSRFVVEAISINGRNVPLFARSSPVEGRRQQPEDRSLFRNSGIGGLALFLLSGFSGIGLLAGAAAGVATTYVAAPQPATIQPGQILQVQLTEDLPQLGF